MNFHIDDDDCWCSETRILYRDAAAAAAHTRTSVLSFIAQLLQKEWVSTETILPRIILSNNNIYVTKYKNNDETARPAITSIYCHIYHNNNIIPHILY